MTDTDATTVDEIKIIEEHIAVDEKDDSKNGEPKVTEPEHYEKAIRNRLL